MKNKQVLTRNVQVMIRYHDRKTITRSRQLKEYISSADDLFQCAIQLFDEHWDLNPVRLLGVTATDLAEKSEATQQLDLFSYEKYAGKEKLYKAIDDLTERIGHNPFKSITDSGNPTVSTSFQKDFLDDFKKE